MLTYSAKICAINQMHLKLLSLQESIIANALKVRNFSIFYLIGKHSTMVKTNLNLTVPPSMAFAGSDLISTI
jgi:hypothetical protein